MASISTTIKRTLLMARRRAIAAAFGLVVAVGLTVAGAQVRGIACETPPKDQFSVVRTGDDFYQNDDWLGSWHKPDQHEYFKKYHRKELYANVVYHTDEFGRRRTVQGRDDWRRFAMFAPCSFSFGDGVNDDETLPSQFAEQVAGEKIAVYNYGVNAWGPNNLLALMTDPRFPAGIPEKQGFVIYSFVGDHIERVIGRRSFLTLNRKLSIPHYVEARDGTLRRTGMVNAAHPAHDTIWDIVADRLGLIGTLFDDWPLGLTQRMRQLTARLIAASQAEFAKRFDAQGFFVLFYPGESTLKPMETALARNGVRWLDYSEAFPYDRETDNVYFQPDGHPTALAYRVIAEKLAADLRELGVLAKK